MRKQTFIKLFAGLLGGLWVLSAAQALVVTPMNLKDISQNAEIVFRGRCEAKKPTTLHHPKTAKEIPANTYTFKTEEVLKGTVSSQIEVSFFNFKNSQEAIQAGYYGPLQSESFEVGKEYLLFLGKVTSWGVRYLMGGSSGQYVIQKDTAGKQTVTKSLNGPQQQTNYEEFKKTIQKLLQE